jgi:hypothetical protein
VSLALLLLVAQTAAPLPPPTEPTRLEVGAKIGWLNRTGASDYLTANIDVEGTLASFRLGESEQVLSLRVPVGLYWIGTARPTFATDARLRVAWGPGFAWLPGFALDVGLLGQSRDWAMAPHGDSSSAATTFLVGGSVYWPLRGVDGAVHIKFGKGLAGPDYTRLSCGLLWYPFGHVGFHVHGDSFWRDLGDHTRRFAGFFGGVVSRW